ncbi:MAG: hypothetical protein AAFQ84_08710, partial [Pseudomonadota bacterium]
MSDTKEFDPSAITFKSHAVPDAEDQAKWDALTPEQQRAVTIHDLDKAEAGGLAPKRTMAEIIAAARARM